MQHYKARMIEEESRVIVPRFNWYQFRVFTFLLICLLALIIQPRVEHFEGYLVIRSETFELCAQTTHTGKFIVIKSEERPTEEGLERIVGPTPAPTPYPRPWLEEKVNQRGY